MAISCCNACSHQVNLWRCQNSSPQNNRWMRLSGDPLFPEAIPFSFLSSIHISLKGILGREWLGSLIPWPLDALEAGCWLHVGHLVGSPKYTQTHMHTHNTQTHTDTRGLWITVIFWPLNGYTQLPGLMGLFCRPLDEFKGLKTMCICVRV